MPADNRKRLIKLIEEKRSSRLICCVTSDRNNAQGVIAKDFLFRFFEHLRQMPLPENKKKLARLDVFLFTIGGDTLAAYALGRFIRQFAEKVGVLIPYTCHSGGTLFSLAADEIVMTRVATLSSIDPSIVGQLNPVVEQGPGQRVPVPVGVESVGGFRNTVREDWRLDEEGSAAAFRLLAEKVHPLLLGDLYRAREQITRLASTLLRLHFDINESKIREIVDTLATGLGSHDYLIGREEARALLQQVAPDNPELEDLIWELYEDFATEMELGFPFDPNVEIQAAAGQPPGPIRKTLKTVLIESENRRDHWERDLNIIQVGPVAQLQFLWNYWRQR